MDNLTFLQEANLWQWFIILVTIAGAFVFLRKLFWKDIIQEHGIETAKMRQRREDHELLIKTSQNLALLQEKSEKDDCKLEDALEVFMDEVRESFDRVDKKIEGFYDNQSKYRGQSMEIQKELTNSIKELADTQKSNSEQISALMRGSKELLGNKIDELYSRYVALEGVPESEIDEFDDIFYAYKQLHGNHRRDSKYEYVKNHLPVIPTKTELVK